MCDINYRLLPKNYWSIYISLRVTMLLTGPMPIQYSMVTASTYTNVGLTSGLLALNKLVTSGQEYIQNVICTDTGTNNGPLKFVAFKPFATVSPKPISLFVIICRPKVLNERFQVFLQKLYLHKDNLKRNALSLAYSCTLNFSLLLKLNRAFYYLEVFETDT